jgi:glycosyltransferase involved in cell wall biosynthesis
MISLCVPTRGRPKLFQRMLRSVVQNAGKSAFEVVAYIDDDDETADKYPPGPIYVRGPRIVQSDMWNKCWDRASGDIAMFASDDMTIDTPNWNGVVEDHYRKSDDRLLMLYGDDGTKSHQAVLLFLSREWIDVVGRFTAPYFVSWYSDRWIWEVAEQINRDRFVPNLHISHPTTTRRFSQPDATYKDGARLREEHDPKSLYLKPEMLAERQAEAMRLCLAIEKAGS